MIPFFSLAMALAATQSAARLSWELFGLIMPTAEGIYHSESAGNSIAPHSDRSRNSFLADQLNELQLFGRAGRVTVAAPDSRDLPETSLQLALVGVIFSTSAKKSVAIINEKNNKSDVELYGVGDKLPGNAVLSEIHSDRVILRRGAVYETLFMEESSATVARSPNNNRLRPDNLRRGIRRMRRPPAPPKDNVGSRLNIDRKYLNKRLANLDSLAGEIGVEPYKEGGKQQGFKIKDSGSSEFLNRLGLQDGDVLTEINGMPVRNTGEAMRAYAKSKNAEKVQVQIIRNGQRQTSEYSIGNF